MATTFGTTMTPVPFGKVSVVIGNGATPEVFTAPCGITSYAWTNPTSTNAEDLPACDSPDSPSYTSPKVVSVGDQFQMQGFLDGSVTNDPWWDWIQSGTAKNVKIVDTQRGIQFAGAAILTARNAGFTRRESGKIDATMAFQARPIQTVIPTT